MMYKSCIFDLDGTLTDTLDSLTFSVNLTMKEMGLPEITREQCRMFVGNGSRVLLEKALRAASEKLLRGWRKRWKYMGESSMRIVCIMWLPMKESCSFWVH